MQKGELLTKSEDFRAGHAAGANRMADYIFNEIKKEYPNNADLLSFIDLKKYEFQEFVFEIGYAGFPDDEDF